MTASSTQKVWLFEEPAEPAMLLVGDRLFERDGHVPSPPGYAAYSIAPVMRPVTSSGELAAIFLSATLLAAAHDDDPVGDGEDVRHAVADQDHGDAPCRADGG